MRAKKPGRYVINAALLHLREDGHLAGAALDTFVTEPLPVESALRATPGILSLQRV